MSAGIRRWARHSGIGGFSTHIVRFMEDKLTMIVLMNGWRARASLSSARRRSGLTLSS